MSTIELSKPLLQRVLSIAEQAGQAILEVYNRQNGELKVETKTDDSPVTEADRVAHQVIVEGLESAFDGVPVCSEESEDHQQQNRQLWSEYWLVDPLDGTKEFINRNGEFTVNIALIRNGSPVLGVVTVPVKGQAFVGGQGLGAYKVEHRQWTPIKSRSVTGGKVVVVGSRRHGAEAMKKLVRQLESEFSQVEMISMGSSLKFCVIAEGKADLYPRLAPTSEWDTAAAQAVLEAAGGKVVNTRFDALEYNKPDTLLNPHFIALGDGSFDWQTRLAGIVE